MPLLSKRWIIFSSESEPKEDEFAKEVRLFDQRIGELIGSRPLAQYSMQMQVSLKKIKENPQAFMSAMRSAVTDIVAAIERRPPGSQSKFKDEIDSLAKSLFVAGWKSGLVVPEEMKLWYASLVNAIKPGDPYKKKIPQYEDEANKRRKS